jgi:hypothetical protein
MHYFLISIFSLFTILSPPNSNTLLVQGIINFVQPTQSIIANSPYIFTVVDNSNSQISIWSLNITSSENITFYKGQFYFQGYLDNFSGFGFLYNDSDFMSSLQIKVTPFKFKGDK